MNGWLIDILLTCRLRVLLKMILQKEPGKDTSGGWKEHLRWSSALFISLTAHLALTKNLKMQSDSL